jgi:FkbM family methyltransferase
MPKRHMLRNAFIDHECARAQLAPAPIDTAIYETYAQCNEDLIVEALLRAAFLPLGRPMSTIRYVELGGNHPIQTSSTYLFYRFYQARGVICEANPKLALTLLQNRPGDTVVNCAVSASFDKTLKLFVSKAHELSSVNKAHIERFQPGFGDLASVAEEIEVPNMHINDFLGKYADNGIDYLSVDVEGLDFQLLAATDWERFRPAFVQCEHEDKTMEFAELLRPKGYDLVAMTDVNALFGRRLP